MSILKNNKVLNFLFSGVFMGILLIIFAISAGYATIVENDFDTATARLLIYNSWWFEMIMVLMTINFTGMIFTRKLYVKEKLNILLIHISFIIILIGAGITRYISFEGQMHIRNGKTTNEILTTDTYFYVQANANGEQVKENKRVILAPINKVLFKKNVRVGDHKVKFALNRFLPNSRQVLKDSDAGIPYIHLVAAGASGRINAFFKEKETHKVGGFDFSFGDDSQPERVVIMPDDSNRLMIRSPYPAYIMEMSGEITDTLSAGEYHPLYIRKLYRMGELTFVIRDFKPSGELVYMPMDDENGMGLDLVELSVNVNEETRNIVFPTREVQQMSIGGVDLSFSVGQQIWTLPFSLKLNEFILERYPGSNSPSSFASEITLIDQKDNVEEPYRIFMNNILEYKGFRFYQSSYDNDEQGTVLSVNHDHWGTSVTYFGYFLLFTSLIISLFTRKTRFAQLIQMLKDIHEKRMKLTVILIGMLITSFTLLPNTIRAAEDDHVVDKEHAAYFGTILTQSKDGRIVPLNTIANNVLVKIFKKNSYKGMTADQVFLEMMYNPNKWQEMPLIKIYEEPLRKKLGLTGDHAAFVDFFDHMNYKIRGAVDSAYAKPPSTRNTYDKEVIAADERLNVCYMIFTGAFLKIYPIPDHPNNKWLTMEEYMSAQHGMDTLMAQIHIGDYLKMMPEAVASGDYEKANKIIDNIQKFQHHFGSAVIPSDFKTDLEIIYNKAVVFKRLFPLYMTVGFILLGMFFLRLFKPSLQFKKIYKGFYYLLFIAFIFHTIGLIVRWYISGHAPWSNGYETMIYISWAMMLLGFIFSKKSEIILSVASILVGITLLTAHMSWLNPEITNLVPVLKSYWLTIHVATITASYAFFTLGAMLAFVNLCIMILRNRKNQERISLTLKELTFIIEMILMVGLIMLVIGNFLGGIWANESWGRYWGWDPKETWSLITIIVYSFIIHMRLIPSFKSVYSTNVLSMFAIASVMMTFFGVNYYLSGLHSYAKGDPVPVPTFVYYTLAIMILVSIGAGINILLIQKNK